MSLLLEHVLRVNLYLQPVQFLLAIVTNLLNIRILSSRTLRSSPCTYYFLAYTVYSLVYTCFVCPTQFLRGYHIDWASGHLGCKIHFYALFVFPFQAKVMLLLASFDRYCSSSKSRQLHSTSTIRKAKTMIVMGSIFAAVYMSPMAMIYEWNEASQKCALRSNLLVHLYTGSQFTFYYILTPILMITLGLLTISNIRRQSIRARPKTPTTTCRRRTEGQLARMLLLQVGVHVILVLPFGVIYTINAFDPSTRTSDALAIKYILILWQQCDYFVSFFLYVFSASIYRQELFRLWRSFRGREEVSSTKLLIHRHTLLLTDFPPITASLVTRIRLNAVFV